MGNKQGIALLLVISLVLMLSILGLGALVISSSHFSTSYQQIEDMRAYYAAEAAMQRILWKLRDNQIGSFPHSETFPETINGIPGTDITITVNPQNVGTVPEGVHPITITVDY